jgi:hypothetical protein
MLGMSQKQLGSRLGYSDVALLAWERNKAKRLTGRKRTNTKCFGFRAHDDHSF